MYVISDGYGLIYHFQRSSIIPTRFRVWTKDTANEAHWNEDRFAFLKQDELSEAKDLIQEAGFEVGKVYWLTGVEEAL